MSRYRVLLLEKDPESLGKSAVLLEHAGYKVEICPSPSDCLWLTRKFHPDCVVLDLPYAGFEMLSSLSDYAPDVVIVAYVNPDEIIPASQVVHCGVKKILQRHFADASFLDSVQQAIAEQHFKRQAA